MKSTEILGIFSGSADKGCGPKYFSPAGLYIMLTFLIIFTYEIEERKNRYHFIKNQQKYDLFTKESLSLIGDIRSDYLQEQLSVWALSDLKFFLFFFFFYSYKNFTTYLTFYKTSLITLPHYKDDTMGSERQ